MANNTTLNAGTGGDVIATDDIAGVKYQRIKLMDGTEDSTAVIPGDATNGLDVDVTRVSGTVTVGGTAAADAAVSGNPIQAGARASAAAPTDVSADGDAVPVWALRSGAVAVQPTMAGVLAVAGNGASGTGVQRVTLANDSTGNIATIGTSVTPGTAAANLGKAEDAAHTSGDVGVMMLGVRRDADTTPVSADGDYHAPQFDNAGNLKVAIKSGAGSGGTSIADAAAFTRGTTSATPIAGVVETSAPTLTNGNAGTISLTTGGAVRVAVASGGVAGVVDDAAVTPGTTEVVMIGATFDDTSPDSVNEGDGGMVRMSANRNLYSTIRDAAGNERGLNVDANGAIAATVTNATAANLNAQVVGTAAADAAVSGNPVLMGGRASTATPTAMSADGDAVQTWLTRTGATVVDGAIVDDAAFTPATSRVVPIAMQADETATDSVDEGDAGCPRMTLDRKQIVTQYVHAAAGGHTPYKNLDVDESEDDIKTSAGKLFWLHVINLANAKRYLKIYNNVAASVTVGTTAPDLTFPIPTMGDTNGAGFTIHFGDAGLGFSTGICIAATTGFADNDAGAPGANEIILNAGYI